MSQWYKIVFQGAVATDNLYWLLLAIVETLVAIFGDNFDVYIQNNKYIVVNTKNMSVKTESIGKLVFDLNLKNVYMQPLAIVDISNQLDCDKYEVRDGVVSIT